ncbi:MAG TPA: hypothetical protein VFE46_01775 [Pirellulales bacterium]|jgi:metal-responsive CopG/Arc/MetJ family transcriptional regulator|nr:hypothetical protein [Pirellulales bacterium]
MRQRTEVISIRVKPEVAGAIDKLRERYGKISRGEWVRHLIASSIYSEERENLAGQLAELRELTEKQQTSLAELRILGLRSIHLLLATTADMDTKEAKQLIRRRILRK